MDPISSDLGVTAGEGTELLPEPLNMDQDGLQAHGDPGSETTLSPHSFGDENDKENEDDKMEGDDSDGSQELSGTDSSAEEDVKGDTSEEGKLFGAVLNLEAGPDSATCSKEELKKKKRKRKTEDGEEPKEQSGLKGPFEGLDVFRLCRICGGNFRNPKLLNCLHTYCTDCIQTLVQCKEEKTFLKCPVCKVEETYEEAPTLPIHHLSKRLAEGKAMAKDTQQCSICALNALFLPAVKICFECKDFLCEGCADKHKFSRFTIDHKITDLDEESWQESLEKVHIESMMCPEHDKEEVRFFCEDCYNLVCRDCVILKHSDHKVLPVNQAVSSRKREFEFRMLGMTQRLKYTERELNSNDDALANLQRLQEKEIAKVKAEVAELKQRLDKEEELAIAAITKKVIGTMKSGKKRKRNAQKLVDRIQEVNSHCLKFLQQSTDEEFLDNQNLFMAAMTTTLNSTVLPEPLSWSKLPFTQTSKIFRLAQTEPLFIVNDRKTIFNLVEDMPTQCFMAQWLAKKVDVSRGLDYAQSVQNKVKAKQRAENKHIKKEEAREMAEALRIINAPSKVQNTIDQRALKVKKVQNSTVPTPGGEDSQQDEEGKKKKKPRNRNKNKDGTTLDADQKLSDPAQKPNAGQEQKPKIKVEPEQGNKKQQHAAMARSLKQKMGGQGHPSQFVSFKFSSQMPNFNAGMNGATAGPLRIPTLTPLWRIDLYLRSDKFQPNITATLCIGLEKVAVADSSNNKIKMFATSGEFLEEHPAFQPVSLAYCAGKLIWCSENTLGFLDLGNKERGEVTFDLDAVPHPLSTGSITQLLIGNGQNLCEYNWSKKEKYWAQTNKILPKHSNKKRFKSNIMSLTNSAGSQTIVYSDWQQSSVVFMDSSGIISNIYREADKQNGFLPTGLFYDRTANTVFVLDHQGNRLVLLNSEAKYVQEWSTLPAIQKPLSVTGNRSGQLFITGSDQFLHVYKFAY
ncbi:E3 ubiquitin-protein ligase TRIM33-like [Mizuhopecten yessoensis]|uniref:E3 ubiquitin-protein ligase TRIM56 n=1 Tax=Mizuhopecten yessoensis TaxID=6573 RepID=A0A210R0F8_MIZYE|nr:E3 ubiquitin-protein ligase TRIM33-like [Mizuhopecten yessoensis]OWF54442.1 E3 ubiquitin-protein ligase TRIM56 [Mizuhopecten yessoensis]